ncbi:acyl-CoA carboxylase subunit epsilon [Streptomyces cellulosae]|uniref:Acyl-CoA carboxylase subunit epsilon n=1 Tax=Streptomyces cellulosae TaxID=1968 RepID=A0ABW7Y3K1_STRCE
MNLTGATAETLIRIDSGAPDDDELAAVTAVLLARIAAPAIDTDMDEGRAVARWRRLERMSGHHTPCSWQSTTPRRGGRAA